MSWPYLTDRSVKISGEFKTVPEDFLVEEIPLYKPCGSGEHLYLLVEKTGLSTDQLINKISRQLGIRARDIGFAGKKDRVGFTRQWLSLGKLQKEKVANIDITNVKILANEYHRNKLRRGHLKGNRFFIVLRNVDQEALQKSKNILEKLIKTGIPNYFGPQRFGAKGDNPTVGWALLVEDWPLVFKLILGNPQKNLDSPKFFQARTYFEEGDYQQALFLWPDDQFFAKAVLRSLIKSGNNFQKAGKLLPRPQLNFYLNSLQSKWFNESLAQRLTKIDRIWEGDLAYLHRNGAVFQVMDTEAEQIRVDKFEISPSGPMWGSKMIRPEEKELRLENTVMEQNKIGLQKLQSLFEKWRIKGERRTYRIKLENSKISQQGNNLHLNFDLPSGSYGTVVIRELLKDNFREPEIVE